MHANRRSQLLWLVTGVTVLAVLGTLWLPALPQDPAYHEFVDQRRLFGIPNFRNVVTNLPFVGVGIATLLWDRLPMAIGFMAVSSVVVSVGVDVRLGQHLLWPLVAVGLLSVLYWYGSELAAAGRGAAMLACPDS